MKCALLFGLTMIVAASVCIAADQAGEKAQNPDLGKVRHVVLFKFKDSTSSEQIKKVEDAFRELPSKIPQIRSFEWGTNMSPEKLDQGFTHCFLLTFRTAQDRDAYLPHPAHKAFGKVLRPHLDKVLVVDFEPKE